ncbi:MFS transporter, partial [Jiangella aurantiaca]
MTILAEAGQTVRWRGGYGRLWSAAVLSRFGDAVRNVALPLVAAGLTTSPFLLSLVSAAGYLPWLVFGLLGGALADRVDRRRAMWTVDVARGLLVAAFATALAFGQAHLAVLAVLAFALTTLQTLFDNAATAILPTLVPRTALPSANARLMTGQALAGTFLGAPAAGLLVTAGVALPFAVDAATYLVAAALIASLPRSAVAVASRPPGSTLRSEIAVGVRRLWRDRLLRGGCLANLLGNLVIGGLQALLVLIITRWAGASDVVFGLVLAAYGAGGVVG